MSADFWAGYLSGAAGILLGNPLDLVKVRLQAGAAPALFPPSSSLSSSSATAFSSPTLRRFATGTAAPLLGYGALNALLFVSYRHAERLLQAPASPVAAAPATTAWLAGAVAGLATWIVSTPTELVKCRAQVASSASSLAVARHVFRAEGVRGFFLGGTVTALRDSIGYGFYFWSYQLATDAWRARAGGVPASEAADSDALGTAGTLLCGGLAGVVTWASVFPLDVIKTRVQAQGVLTGGEGVQAPLLGSAPRRSTLAIARDAYRADGLAVFFRGLGVCSARAFFVNAVQWAVYEWAMRAMR